MMAKSKGTAAGKAAPEKRYQASDKEVTAMMSFFRRRDAAPAVPRVKITRHKSELQIGPDHPEPGTGGALLMEGLATSDPDFLNGMLCQLANAAVPGQSTDDRGVNFMLAVMKGIQPKDQVETMLAAQMAGVHMATMTMARRLAHAETLVQQDSAERAFNKLTRTFAAQMEALKRYRTGGQQKVIVEHVTINDGGQAIVGNVIKHGTADGAGAPEKIEERAHAKRIAHAPQPTLQCPDPAGNSVPIARGSRQG